MTIIIIAAAAIIVLLLIPSKKSDSRQESPQTFYSARNRAMDGDTEKGSSFIQQAAMMGKKYRR